MTSLFRARVLASLVFVALPALASAQLRSDDALVRRIEQLERRTNELEFRVRELETPPKTEQPRTAPTAPAGNARDLANWRRLRRGMSMDDVRELLGEPDKIDGGGVAFWHWRSGHVVFMNDTVHSWTEPRR